MIADQTQLSRFFFGLRTQGSHRANCRDASFPRAPRRRAGLDLWASRGDPRILILDITSQRPRDKAGEIITTIPLRYEERPPARPYTLVMTANGVDSVTIDIGQAH